MTPTLSSEDRARRCITPELAAAYRHDGAVCVRQLLSPPEVALLREGIDANLAQPSARAKVASRPGDPGFFIEDFCNWQENEAYRHLIFDSPLAAAAGALTGSQTIRLYHDHMLTKEPGTRTPTPWHQDQPYYNIEGTLNCSMWIAVDPVRRHSTLEFVAGSHLGPWLMPRSFMDHQAKWFPEGSLAELPDIDAMRNAPLDSPRILGWDIEPGDVVCFHMLALHAAGGVDGNRRRRVFSLRFIGDDMRHAPRRWATSPDFPGLADELPAGAPMVHALFPLLWRRPA
jgi:ectoine hydroxylase-related dioxygenase (phytanoyl-CoA dioxygenase family)